MKHKTFIILVLFLSFIAVKFAISPLDYDNIYENNKNDLGDYIKCRNDILGLEGSNHQVPPLYPVLLIPSVHTFYIYGLNILLSGLTVISIFYICSEYFDTKKSLFISVFLGFFYYWFSVPTFGYPIALASLLMLWFFYFFNKIEYNKPYTNLYISGVLFGMLLLTKYIFVYMIPFIFLWILFKKRNSIIKSYRIVFIFCFISFGILSLWFFRNGLLYGFSYEGFFGFYERGGSYANFIKNSISFKPKPDESIKSVLLSFKKYTQILLSYMYIGFFAIFMFLDAKFNLSGKKAYLFCIGVNLFIFCIISTFIFGVRHNKFYYRYLTYYFPFVLTYAMINMFKFRDYAKKLSYN